MHCTFKSAINAPKSLRPPQHAPQSSQQVLIAPAVQFFVCVCVRRKPNSISPSEGRIRLRSVKSEESLGSAAHCLRRRDTQRDILSADIQTSGSTARGAIAHFQPSAACPPKMYCRALLNSFRILGERTCEDWIWVNNGNTVCSSMWTTPRAPASRTVSHLIKQLHFKENCLIKGKIINYMEI